MSCEYTILDFVMTIKHGFHIRRPYDSMAPWNASRLTDVDLSKAGR